MEIEIIELAVSCEREIPELALPFLGQCTVMGNIEALLQGASVHALRMFIPACASSQVRRYMDCLLDDGSLADAATRPLPFTAAAQWFEPAEGRKTVRAIQAALKTQMAGRAGLAPIARELADEAGRLEDYLETAGIRGIRFQLQLAICANPPRALVSRVADEYADLGQWLGNMMSEVGMDKREANV